MKFILLEEENKKFKVTGIDLLSYELYDKWQNHITPCDGWWLKDADEENEGKIFYVNHSGDIKSDKADYDEMVRPVLYVDGLKQAGVRNGQLVYVYGEKWIYLDNNAILKANPLGHRSVPFSKKGECDYEKSDIKVILQKALSEYVKNGGEYCDVKVPGVID